MHPTSHMSGPRWMWMPTDAPTFARLFAWHPQPVPLSLVVTLLAALCYGYLIVRLRRRGGRWSVWPTLSFALGIAVTVVLTGTALNGYSMALFSVHMVQHMLLSMLVPPLLLAGRPLTLTLRALDGTRAGRMVEAVAMSKVMWVLTAVPVALLIFLAGMYAFYFTPIFDDLMANWLTHELMLVFYIASGYLLYWPILDLDPSPHHMSRPIAFLASILATPFHSFFAVIVMGSTSLIVGTFSRPMPSWHLDPVKDQQLGGGLAWAFADVPNLILIVIIAVQWVLESRREAADVDRRADEDHDAELAAYNEWLAAQQD